MRGQPHLLARVCARPKAAVRSTRSSSRRSSVWSTTPPFAWTASGKLSPGISPRPRRHGFAPYDGRAGQTLCLSVAHTASCACWLATQPPPDRCTSLILAAQIPEQHEGAKSLLSALCEQQNVDINARDVRSGMVAASCTPSVTMCVTLAAGVRTYRVDAVPIDVGPRDASGARRRCEHSNQGDALLCLARCKDRRGV